MAAVWAGHLALFYVDLGDVIRERGKDGGRRFSHFEQDMMKRLKQMIVYHLWLLDRQRSVS